MLLDYKDLRPKKGVNYSRDHLRRKSKNQTFPQPIEISERRIAWIEEEVDAWIAARIAERDARHAAQSRGSAAQSGDAT